MALTTEYGSNACWLNNYLIRQLDVQSFRSRKIDRDAFRGPGRFRKYSCIVRAIRVMWSRSSIIRVASICPSVTWRELRMLTAATEIVSRASIALNGGDAVLADELYTFGPGVGHVVSCPCKMKNRCRYEAEWITSDFLR